MEYTDHLKKHMEDRAKRYVDEMGDNAPDELKELPKGRLIYNLVDFATPILRGIEDYAIQSACYQLTTMIRWSKQNPDARK